MERFVKAIIAGGVALVVGLWAVTYADVWSLPWLFGAALALAGGAALAVGIGLEVDY